MEHRVSLFDGSATVCLYETPRGRRILDLEYNGDLPEGTKAKISNVFRKRYNCREGVACFIGDPYMRIKEAIFAFE
ncbi:MAG: hypothetical protein QMD85_00115 [Candidatus Aenigmarchaeota archaeon]|nr:hypothetical protein [Candidatus Aenigmarchaeota archaeon]